MPTQEPSPRHCSKVGCSQPAVSTLTYVYAEQTVVVGPLATESEPHVYDLCASHTARLTAPRGWQVMRLAIDLDDPTGSVADIGALADAVRDQRAGRDQGPEQSGDWPGPPRLRLVSGGDDR
ncbi:hypothetical protein BJF82_06930 [Kytococcus sp. CUA-901]|nr:hypothetical protein BJF82_06930 [Kytococcus sp. CUA-901]